MCLPLTTIGTGKSVPDLHQIDFHQQWRLLNGDYINKEASLSFIYRTTLFCVGVAIIFLLLIYCIYGSFSCVAPQFIVKPSVLKKRNTEGTVLAQRLMTFIVMTISQFFIRHLNKDFLTFVPEEYLGYFFLFLNFSTLYQRASSSHFV